LLVFLRHGVGPHSVTCHLIQVNAAHLNPCQ